jgi:ribosomal protein S18 acetylase RimI-like enzyme
MIHFEKMRVSEFEKFTGEMTPEYAKDLEKSMLITAEDAKQRAEDQLQQLLPEGMETEGHHFFTVKTDEKQEAGALWIFMNTDEKRAFIYDIVVHERFRGQGYGKATLAKLEEVVREMGGNAIGLHVFGDNERAEKLYRKMGYEVVSMNMLKRI